MGKNSSVGRDEPACFPKMESNLTFLFQSIQFSMPAFLPVAL
ncbi:MAG: hypothetical protein ACTSWN_13340 [Promethearchaeota archaeon]